MQDNDKYIDVQCLELLIEEFKWNEFPESDPYLRAARKLLNKGNAVSKIWLVRTFSKTKDRLDWSIDFDRKLIIPKTVIKQHSLTSDEIRFMRNEFEKLKEDYRNMNDWKSIEKLINKKNTRRNILYKSKDILQFWQFKFNWKMKAIGFVYKNLFKICIENLASSRQNQRQLPLQPNIKRKHRQRRRLNKPLGQQVDQLVALEEDVREIRKAEAETQASVDSESEITEESFPDAKKIKRPQSIALDQTVPSLDTLSKFEQTSDEPANRIDSPANYSPQTQQTTSDSAPIIQSLNYQQNKDNSFLNGTEKQLRDKTSRLAKTWKNFKKSIFVCLRCNSGNCFF